MISKLSNFRHSVQGPYECLGASSDLTSSIVSLTEAFNTGAPVVDGMSPQL